MQASLSCAKDPSSALILGRFWDAVLGTPPQSIDDERALSGALADLANSADMEGGLALLLQGLQARAKEPSIVCRYSGCAPLLRIAGALLSSNRLLSALGARDFTDYVQHIIQSVMTIATMSMQGGTESCTPQVQGCPPAITQASP